MAYRRKSSARKTYGRSKSPSRKRSYKGRRAAPKRRKTAKRRSVARKPQRIVLVIQHAPVTPTLATPASKAAPVRARFGG